MSRHPLAQKLTAKSCAANWAAAQKEWDFVDVEQNDDAETCLCEHYPIKEVCIIRNRENGNEERVGNHCVRIFIKESEKIFRTVRSLRKNLGRSANMETLDHARKRGWITEWDYKFSVDTLGKRILSEKQKYHRERINQKILARVTKQSAASGAIAKPASE